MTESTAPRILVVDDDVDGLEVLRTRLVHAGYEVETAESAEKALSRLKAFDPGLIVTDVRMSGMTGLELLEKVRASMETVEVVVMTAHDDMQTAVTAMKAGAFDFLVKPVDPKAVQGPRDLATQDQCEAGDQQRDRGQAHPQHPLNSAEGLATNLGAGQRGGEIPSRAAQAVDGVELVDVLRVALDRPRALRHG
jgi:DNA-binding NtrC family response regulator